jgi:hypothetical protein
MNLGVKMQHKAPSHTTVESSESENSPLKQVHVVVGIVWKDNKFLVQQRPLNSKQFPGLWELPGGFFISHFSFVTISLKILTTTTTTTTTTEQKYITNNVPKQSKLTPCLFVTLPQAKLK